MTKRHAVPALCERLPQIFNSHYTIVNSGFAGLGLVVTNPFYMIASEAPSGQSFCKCRRISNLTIGLMEHRS